MDAKWKNEWNRYIYIYLAMLHNVCNHIDQARSDDDHDEAAAALSEGVDLAQG